MKLRLLFIMAAVLSVTAVMAQTQIQRKVSGSQKILLIIGDDWKPEITTNFNTLFSSHTITTIDTSSSEAVPIADFATYDQIWDARGQLNELVDNDILDGYEAFLKSGKRLFFMGETSSRSNRNSSLIDFVVRMGGGTINVNTDAPNKLNVVAPFNANDLSTVTFKLIGGSTSAGTGQFIVQNDDATLGGAIFWNKGTLSEAPNGTLITVLDVNFMTGREGDDDQQFLKNIFAAMEGTLEEPTPPAAPIETHTVTFATAPGISLSVGNREEVQSGNTIIVYITIDPEGLRADVPTPIVKVDGKQVTVHESRTAADFYFRTPSITKDTRVEISFDGSPLSNNAPDANLTIYSGNGQLTVEASEPVQLTIVSLSGQVIMNQRVTGGAHTFSLPAGVYVVNGRKIIAP